MENTNTYQSITTVQGVLEYLDKVDGFRDFSLGRMNYDSAFQMFTIGIEEVLDSDNWPEESNGRVWYLKFGSIRNIKIDIDAPTGLWASDMFMSEDGNFVIESNQGTITVMADVIELQVPAGAENGVEVKDSAADNAPLSFKNLFNDLKNTFTGKSSQPNAQPQSAAAPTAEAAQPAQPVDPWGNPQAAPAPAEIAQPVMESATQPFAQPVAQPEAQPAVQYSPAPEPIATQPIAPAEPVQIAPPIRPDNSGTMPGGPVFG